MRKTVLSFLVAFLIFSALCLGFYFFGFDSGRRSSLAEMGIAENQEFIIANIKRLGVELREIKPTAQRIDDFCTMVEKNFPEIFAIRGKLDDYGRFNLLMGRPLDMRPVGKSAKKD